MSWSAWGTGVASCCALRFAPLGRPDELMRSSSAAGGSRAERGPRRAFALARSSLGCAIRRPRCRAPPRPPRRPARGTTTTPLASATTMSQDTTCAVPIDTGWFTASTSTRSLPVHRKRPLRGRRRRRLRPLLVPWKPSGRAQEQGRWTAAKGARRGHEQGQRQHQGGEHRQHHAHDLLRHDEHRHQQDRARPGGQVDRWRTCRGGVRVRGGGALAPDKV